MISTKEAFIKLHISVVLAGLTGLFGKLVSLHQLPMVWYRVAITGAIAFLWLMLTGRLRRIPVRDMLRIGMVGVILALHWVFFFGSIKASNISVGVVCYSLVGFYTALIEPAVYRTRYSLRDIALSLVTVAGIALIFQFDTHYRYGIVLGMISSLFASVFTIANKKIVDSTDYKPMTMLMYEMAGGVLVISVVIAATIADGTEMRLLPSASDLCWLVILAGLCTVGLQLFQIQSLERLSAFTVNLTYNLEPVYTIIIALTVFGEARTLSPAFFAGLTLIILSVAAKTLLVIRHR